MGSPSGRPRWGTGIFSRSSIDWPSLSGGEQSGHIIFRDYLTTGDGLITALQLLSLLDKEGISLDDAARVMEPYPQILKTLPVRSKPPIESLPELSKRKAHVDSLLSGHGRLLLRYSGTEMAIRIMLEGPDANVLNQMMQELEEAVILDLGSPSTSLPSH